ncbi:hypothetical protein B566_EDAN013136, partial [Ephemera danica]
MTTTEFSPLPFRYTLDNPDVLSHKQGTFYEDHGYIVIPNLIDDQLTKDCRDRFIGICEGTVPKSAGSVPMKDISLLKSGAKGQHLYYKIQNIHQDEGFDDHFRVTLPMNKGDTVFLHPLLIHGSGINITKGFRKAMTCFYAASECNIIDVKGTENEKFMTEWVAVMKK